MPKRQPHVRAVGAAPVPTYAELHCRTNFTFLEAASHPDEMVQQAAELGDAALAITDRNSLAGVVRAHAAAKEVGLKLLIGAEITPADAPPAVLLATDRAAYGRLASLITRGRRRAAKGECRLTFDDVAAHAEGLLCGVLLNEADGSGATKAGHERRKTPGVSIDSSAGKKNSRGTCRQRLEESETPGVSGGGVSGQTCGVHRYGELFGDRCYGFLSLHFGPDDARLLGKAMRTTRKAGVPLVASHGVRYHVPRRRFLSDVLTAIRQRCTVAELGRSLPPNSECFLRSPAEMAALFGEHPEAIARTLEVAGRCTFSLDELRFEYPHELCPAGLTPLKHLTRLTWAGGRERYPQGVPRKVGELIEHELALIGELRFEAYFLTVWDLVRFARRRGILCQGRGSAANSAVCYCLGVTSVDPDRIDVLFERFVSKERNEAPDIDVDFEHERREEVLQYVYDKYGRDRAAMTAEVITYRPRSAIRDVGKALGLSLDCVDRMAKSVDHLTNADDLACCVRAGGVDPLSRTGRQLLVLVRDLLGFPRHLSQHVGGLVISHTPLPQLVPIENAAMPGRTVLQWDKDDLDELGILKVDCLSLGMLSAIRKCFELIAGHHGRPLTLATVPPEDPAVYDMICEADTKGLFQIESRAQMAMLPRLQPRCFYDLVIEVAIVRPGPIQGDMVHPYLKRRQGQEPVEYPDDRIRAVLHKTLGVPLFQEQAMRLAVVAAGFTPGEADQLRKAMAAWRKRGILEPFRQKLIKGMRSNGYSPEFAERVFKQIRGFGEYGFPESHAASFALLVYVSAWLKRYYPAAFSACVLNSQPMGFYSPDELTADASEHGVPLRPVDVNRSDWDCTLEPADGPSPAIRLGLRMVRGLPERDARAIIAARAVGVFESFDDFARRAGLSRAALSRLSRADVFGTLALNRRDALWNALEQREPRTLFDATGLDGAGVDGSGLVEPIVALPEMSRFEEVAADYRSTGLSLKGHPMQFLRPGLDRQHVIPAAGLPQIPTGRRVRVAGIVRRRQHPSSAKGVTFVTLEDETGDANLIVWPTVWERFRRVAHASRALLVTGELQHQQGVTHVIVNRMADLSERLAGIPTKSRDFQ